MPKLSDKKKTIANNEPINTGTLNSLPPEVILNILSQAAALLPARDTTALFSANRRLRKISSTAYSLKTLEDAYANTDNEMELERQICELENKPNERALRFHQFYIDAENRFYADLLPRATHCINLNAKCALALGAIMMLSIAYLCSSRYRNDPQSFTNYWMHTAANRSMELTMLSIALLTTSVVALGAAFTALYSLKTADKYRDPLITKPTAFFASPGLNRRYHQQGKLAKFRDKVHKAKEKHIQSPQGRKKAR